MARNVRLDHKGIAEVLKSAPVRAAVVGLAEQVASRVRAAPSVGEAEAPVIVETYTTDRAAAAVLVKHPAGMGLQAKYGALTGSAGDVGLQVRRKGGAS